MQEKVKIFTSGIIDEFTELENQVNTWLVENNKIAITSRQMKLATGVNKAGNTFVNCTIVIFYEENA